MLAEILFHVIVFLDFAESPKMGDEPADDAPPSFNTQAPWSNSQVPFVGG